MTLIRHASMGLTDQLVRQVIERIGQQVYASGARLPSVRAMARSQGVSPHTVVQAYDRLVAQGWAEAKPQQGFFVRPASKLSNNSMLASVFKHFDATKIIANESPPADPSSPESARTAESAGHASTQAATHASAPTHASALIRALFSHTPGPQPAMGVLPTSWVDTPVVASALRAVSGVNLGRSASQYGDPQGDRGLRQALSQRLAGFGVICPAQHIVTTLGATHALDIASRTMLQAGDAVMVEEPGWAVEFARLSALGMRVLGVPRGPDGPDLAVMRRHCEHPDPRQRPKLFVSVSVLHNPTGASLSAAFAHQVLQLAQEFGFYVLEDDTYAHFAPDHATRMAALDSGLGLQRVVYVGGFAKALAPAWRVGFLAAPQSLVERLIDTKMLATLTTPSLMERAMAHVIERGQLRKHSERLRQQLQVARDASVQHALQAGCTLAAPPAGLFGWVDVGFDTDKLAPTLLDAGHLIAPGGLFYAQRRPTSLMRVNFAATQDPPFWQALAKARALAGP